MAVRKAPWPPGGACATAGRGSRESDGRAVFTHESDGRDGVHAAPIDLACSKLSIPEY